MTNGTNRKRRFHRKSNWSSQRLKSLVEEWDLLQDKATENGIGITFVTFCKNNGIPYSTLQPYCCRDKSKRRKLTTNRRALIPSEQLKTFVNDSLGLKKSILIQELKKKFGLNLRQAHNQYNNHIKSLEVGVRETFIGRKVAKYFKCKDKIFCGAVISYDHAEHWWSVRYDDGDVEEMDSDELELARNLYVAWNVPHSFSNSSNGENGQYLVYQLRRLDGRYRQHPLRNHQPASVKNANRGVTDGAYYSAASIQVAISVSTHENDLFILHRGLHHVPHGTGFLRTKDASDIVLRNNDVDVIDVPEDMARFGMDREDDGVFVFRSGTNEVGMVSMTSVAIKKAFLQFFRHEQCKRYLSADVGRDVGNNVYRYDLLFNQGQGNCDKYSDINGNIVVDSGGNPLRVPFLRNQTEMLRFMPDTIKEELTRVLVGMDKVTQRVYPGAFPDERRRDLVHDYFVSAYLGDDVRMNWEYLGIIARQLTNNDRLAMHLDSKNDWRNGYDYCTTYSFVIDGYRVTIVAACKQDFGSLMDRLDEVEVEGGRFLSHET